MTLKGAARAAWIVIGLAALAWIGFEDRGSTAVIGLSWSAGVAGMLTARSRRSGAAGWGWWLAVGGGAGALVAMLAALLILVKTGLHAHPSPDFSLQDVTGLLRATPAWALAGAMLGSGAALLEASRRP